MARMITTLAQNGSVSHGIGALMMWTNISALLMTPSMANIDLNSTE